MKPEEIFEKNLETPIIQAGESAEEAALKVRAVAPETSPSPKPETVSTAETAPSTAPASQQTPQTLSGFNIRALQAKPAQTIEEFEEQEDDVDFDDDEDETPETQPTQTQTVAVYEPKQDVATTPATAQTPQTTPAQTEKVAFPAPKSDENIYEDAVMYVDLFDTAIFTVADALNIKFKKIEIENAVRNADLNDTPPKRVLTLAKRLAVVLKKHEDGTLSPETSLIIAAGIAYAPFAIAGFKQLKNPKKPAKQEYVKPEIVDNTDHLRELIKTYRLKKWTVKEIQHEIGIATSEISKYIKSVDEEIERENRFRNTTNV